MTHSASLADAITITCSVQCHINMQVIGVRRVSARTKPGREPSACRSPDRVNDVSHSFISVWLYPGRAGADERARPFPGHGEGRVGGGGLGSFDLTVRGAARHAIR